MGKGKVLVCGKIWFNGHFDIPDGRSLPNILGMEDQPDLHVTLNLIIVEV